MAVAEGKTPAERNKMIVAVALGAIAIISLAYMFLGGSSSGPVRTSNTNSNTTRTQTTSTQRNSNAQKVGDSQEDLLATMRPVVYPGPPGAVPEAGRNIFAFYVAPTPTPKPVVVPTVVPTPPPPQPNVAITSISPVNVYAHTGEFTLDVMGDKFTPQTLIFIGGAQLQTRFVSPQQLSTKVPAQLISFEGGREVKVQSPDGTLFSNTATLNVMPAPVPNFILIGVFIRRGSNDTAILKDKNGGKDLLTVQRGDIVGGRFRVTGISSREITLVDTTLKIKYPLPLVGDNSNPGGQPRVNTPPTPPDDEGEP